MGAKAVTVESEDFAAGVPPAISRRMRSNRSKNTKPELALRKELHRRGLRYRVHMRPEPDLNATADVVFTRAGVAVFVDGCFWHGCPEHYRPATSTRTEFWADKIAENRRRDERTSKALESAGWSVLRFWEHEPPAACATAIAATVRRRIADLPRG